MLDRRFLSTFAFFAMMSVIASGCGRPPVIQARAALEPAPTATPAPTAPEIPLVELEPATSLPNADPGVTGEVIRLAMVSDGRAESGAPDMFVSARRGIEAWARAVNARGGLAERNVEVVIFESAVSNAADIVQEICEGDFFAMVGSLSYYDDAGVDIMNSADCLIPDFPAAALSPLRKASAVTYLSDPYSNEQYDVAALRERLLSDPAAAKLSANVQFETTPFLAESIRMREAAESIGYGFGAFLVQIGSGSDMAVQAEQLASSDADSLVWTGAPTDLVSLLQVIDEIDPEALEFAICTFGCYDRSFTDALGSVSTPVYTAIPHLPFDEQDLSSQIREYLLWMGDGSDPLEQVTATETAEATDEAATPPGDETGDGADGGQGDGDGTDAQAAEETDEVVDDAGDVEAVTDTDAGQTSDDEEGESPPNAASSDLIANASTAGFAAWVAGRLFEQTVNDAVRLGTDEYDPALLTRTKVLESVRQIESWDARGAYGEASPASRIPSSCMVTMALIEGVWQRAFPTLRGSWDCSPENIALLRATADYGLGTAIQSSSTNSESPPPVEPDPVAPEASATQVPGIADPLESSEEPAGG